MSENGKPEHYDDAKWEHVPMLLALLVHEIQGLRGDLSKETRPTYGDIHIQPPASGIFR